MQEIIKDIIPEKVELVELKDVNYPSNNRIYLSEKGKCQSILTKRGNIFFWRGFYLDQTARTGYKTFQEAITSRFEKKQKVFILNNKTELKEMIKPSNW